MAGLDSSRARERRGRHTAGSGSGGFGIDRAGRGGVEAVAVGVGGVLFCEDDDDDDTTLHHHDGGDDVDRRCRRR